MERSPVHRRMYLSLKDNAKIRHGESGNIRKVPHRSARFRKVPICSFHFDKKVDFRHKNIRDKKLLFFCPAVKKKKALCFWSNSPRAILVNLYLVNSSTEHHLYANVEIRSGVNMSLATARSWSAVRDWMRAKSFSAGSRRL